MTGPVLRVVRGNPDDEELAALTAVVVSAVASGAAAGGEAVAGRSEWGNPAHRVRSGLVPGPGAWRMSGRPH
ncbi:MAG TPA: acyl-CoA carboxylase subunit epsilon [Umezawaea sp.]|nr:acyl-CoA carboxylase subunit epsilon [Umezawaea sp.]